MRPNAKGSLFGIETEPPSCTDAKTSSLPTTPQLCPQGRQHNRRSERTIPTPASRRYPVEDPTSWASCGEPTQPEFCQNRKKTVVELHPHGSYNMVLTTCLLRGFEETNRRHRSTANHRPESRETSNFTAAIGGFFEGESFTRSRRTACRRAASWQ